MTSGDRRRVQAIAPHFLVAETRSFDTAGRAAALAAPDPPIGVRIILEIVHGFRANAVSSRLDHPNVALVLEAMWFYNVRARDSLAPLEAVERRDD
jgi:hypothetical protein